MPEEALWQQLPPGVPPNDGVKTILSVFATSHAAPDHLPVGPVAICMFSYLGPYLWPSSIIINIECSNSSTRDLPVRVRDMVTDSILSKVYRRILCKLVCALLSLGLNVWHSIFSSCMGMRCNLMIDGVARFLNVTLGFTSPTELEFQKWKQHEFLLQ
jgi:hypothetical protein